MTSAMSFEGIVIFEARSGIPLFYKLKSGMDPAMLSSFIAAARHFLQDLNIGGLTSFSTAEKVIFLASTEKTVTALIASKSPEFQEFSELALEICEEFEHRYEIPERPQPMMYTDFRSIAEEMLKRVKDPFLNRVARFAHEEYGGEISIKARLMKSGGGEGTIDILVNHSQKLDGDSKYRPEDLTVTLLSQNLTFIKAIDGVASRGDVIDFIDSIDDYGVMMIKKDGAEFRPYYPKKAVIVARDYAPDVMELMARLPKIDDRPYIDGRQIVAGLKKVASRGEQKCFIELWTWRENSYPKKIIG